MSTELFDLTGQVAVVIGGARDLGRDMAESLADAGCHLAITSRQEATAQATAEHLKRPTAVRCTAPPSTSATTPPSANSPKTCASGKAAPIVVVTMPAGGLGLSTTDLFERKPEEPACSSTPI